MKNILPLLVLASFSAFAGELSLTLNCKTELMTDGDVATLTERPVVLSTAGKNAHIFQTELGSDQDNSVIVALQEVSKTCADSSCSQASGTVFSLVIARIEDPTRNALQMSEKAKITGETSATAQITVSNSGRITSSFARETKIFMGVEGIPAELGFEYRISRKRFENQKVSVSCSIAP